MPEKKLHILVIPSWYNTAKTPQQGRIFEEHTEMLQRAGYKVGVLYPCFLDGFVARILRGARNKTLAYHENGIPTYVVGWVSIVPFIRSINYRYAYLKAKKQFLKYVETNGWPDIIQAHTSLIGGVVAYFISKKYKIPYIITEHASALIWGTTNFEDAGFIKKVFKNAQNSIVVSNFFKNELVKKFSIETNNLSVIHNNVNPIFFQPPSAIIEKNPFVFINIGGLVPVKNHKLLIDAFEIVADKYPEIILRIVGDGPQRKSLDEYIKNKKIENRVFLLGGLNREEVKKEIDRANALISTSHIETFGINIIEALASGKPVIATDSGGPRDIISLGDGYIVKEHNPTSVAKAMIDMIHSYKTFNHVEISANCFLRFSEGAIVNQLDKIFKRKYQVCSRCIIDTIDYPQIVFDANGVCNICHINDKYIKSTVVKGVRGISLLNEILFKIKKIKNRNGYNCILGISGGIDSTYLALLTKKWGLRPLVVHIDNGWNSETAVSNIEKFLKKIEFDLHTYVVNWEAMKDMNYAFLKSSVIDIELPYDNKFIAMLYKIAVENKLKYILCGYNSYSEGILPPNFNHYKYDSLNISDIHKKFGREKRIEFSMISPFRYFYYKRIRGIEMISPLNYIDYNKKQAKNVLMKELDWTDYGYKHYENIFTRFYQGYILPGKFYVDKRKAHLSALICSNQITREEAINELKNNIYGKEELLISDKNFVLKKLDITNEEFDKIMSSPIRRHSEFKSYINFFNKIPTFIKHIMRIILYERT
jgi:N-acetyl sugar amidotransferase